MSTSEFVIVGGGVYGAGVAWELATKGAEVRLLEGRPGSHVVLARRHGDEWWVGGINGTTESLQVAVDLGSLGSRFRRLGDGPEPRTLAAATVDGEQRITMAPRGGFVVWPVAG